MSRPSPPALIRSSRQRDRSFISPARNGRGQHPATPTISPPPEYTSRDGSLPTSDQDSIEAIPLSNASSYESYPPECDWDGKIDKKPAKEKPMTSEKRLEPKNSTKQTVECEPGRIQIWLTILQLPRKTRWGWLLVALLIVLICVLFPILWIDAYHAGSQGAKANSTSTVTVTISEPTITNVVTKTPSAAVFTTVLTSTVSETPTPTSTTSAPSPTPTRIGGFAVMESEDGYGDLSVSLFWVDDNGNINQLNADSTAANGWDDAGKFTSNVRVGSAVSYAYASYSTCDYFFYVSEDYIIQDFCDDSGEWEQCTLSSLELKTSESMNFMACAPWTTTTDGTNNLAEIYVFYNSSDGYVRVAELSNGQWLSSPDTPFSVSAGFVGCDSDYYGNLLTYVVNEGGQLEQWSLKKDLTNPWTLDLQHDGPYNPQTLIYSVTASQNSQGRSHIFLQDPENMIVRLDTYGLGTNTTVVGRADIAHAVIGTRMAASGDCNSTVNLYYQTNDTEMREYSMVDDAVNNAVFMLGGSPVQSDLPFGSGAGKVMTALDRRIVLCLIAALCLFW